MLLQYNIFFFFFGLSNISYLRVTNGNGTTAPNGLLNLDSSGCSIKPLNQSIESLMYLKPVENLYFLCIVMICYKSVENQEICDAIWENQPHDENLTL